MMKLCALLLCLIACGEATSSLSSSHLPSVDGAPDSLAVGADAAPDSAGARVDAMPAIDVMVDAISIDAQPPDAMCIAGGTNEPCTDHGASCPDCFYFTSQCCGDNVNSQGVCVERTQVPGTWHCLTWCQKWPATQGCPR